LSHMFFAAIYLILADIGTQLRVLNQKIRSDG
jgi:hypothetical protein